MGIVKGTELGMWHTPVFAGEHLRKRKLLYDMLQALNGILILLVVMMFNSMLQFP